MERPYGRCRQLARASGASRGSVKKLSAPKNAKSYQNLLREGPRSVRKQSGTLSERARAKKIPRISFRTKKKAADILQEAILAPFRVLAGTRKSAKNGPEAHTLLIFFRPEIVFLRFLRSGAFREGPGPIPEAPEALRLPVQIFFKNFTILFCWFLRFFFAGCVPILSGFVGFRRDVAGIRIQTQ